MTVDYNIAIDSSIATQRIDWEYADMLVYQRESAAPFLAFLTKLAMQASVTSIINWFEDRPMPDVDTLGAASLVSASNGAKVTVTPTNITYFKTNDVIEFPDAVLAAGETNQALITAIGADKDGGVNAAVFTARPYSPILKLAANANGAKVYRLFTSYQQASTGADPQLERPTLYTNRSTILRDSYRIAKTTENERFFGAPERARARLKKEIKHMRDICKVLYFGNTIDDTTYYTNRRTQTKGLENFITTNVFNYGLELSSSELFDYMKTIHENAYGAEGDMNKRLVFASSGFVKHLQTMVLPLTSFQNSIPTEWGANLSRLVWAGYTWDIVVDPMLTEFRQGTAFVTQPRYMRYRPFRPTQFRANLQVGRDDFVEDEFSSEINFELKLEELFAKIEP